MAVHNEIRPPAWPRLLEGGVLSDQFEAGNVSRQLTVVGDEFKLLVDSGSRYGDSTGLRALGRVTAPGSRLLKEGRRVGFAKRFRIPEQRLDGWTLIEEAHGPGGYVAPLRVLVRPNGRLYVAYNSGRLSGTAGDHWSPEIDCGPFSWGVEHVLAGEIVFSASPNVGYFKLLLDGQVVHERQWPTAQTQAGEYQYPWLMTGLYVGSVDQGPVTCFIKHYVLADTMEEALALVDPPIVVLPPPAPEPDPNAEVREEIRAEISILRRTLTWAKIKTRPIWRAFKLVGGR